MQFVVPMTVDNTNLTTDVVNVETPWTAGTYNLGDRRTEGELVYEVVADPTTSSQPSVGAAEATPTWIVVGYNNQYRMWRDGSDSLTSVTGDIKISVPIPSVINTVGVLNATGAQVNIKLIDSDAIAAPIIEDIAGTKDGINTAFTITDAGLEVYVYLDGDKMTEGTDYTRVTTAITATGSIPTALQSYIAVIHTAEDPAIENIAGTKNDVNTAFTITASGGVAVLYLNGKKLTDTVHYTRAGTAITAIAGSIPGASDLYEAIIFTTDLPTIDAIPDADGVATEFVLSVAGEASLYLNGVRLVEGVDYDKGPTTGISITGGAIPLATDDFDATIYPSVVYDYTKSIADIGVPDWWSFFFLDYRRYATIVFDDIPAYAGATVTLEFHLIATGPSDTSSVGRVVLGRAIDAGQSLMGITSRNLTFTRKDRDEFGNLTLVPRRTIRVVDFPVMIPSANATHVQQEAAGIASTPTLFIGNPDLSETVVFGVLENFDIIVNNLSKTECSIGVEEF